MIVLLIMRKKGSPYKVRTGLVAKKPYSINYKHYIPSKIKSRNIIVLIQGAGHLMKTWEETPDGRRGWAPLFAENGREVITFNWASSPSKKQLCSLTQKENIDLICKIISKALNKKRKIILLGWSMGGPQAFKIAADIFPKQTIALLGYGATGPINSYSLKFKSRHQQTDLSKPITISVSTAKKITNSPLFLKKWLKAYRKKYLVPFSPTMLAIQAQQEQVKHLWPVLTVKNPKNLPPMLLLNGTLDPAHPSEKEKYLKNWIKKFQPDNTIKYLKNLPHVGMLTLNNEQPIKIYLEWLRKRGL